MRRSTRERIVSESLRLFAERGYAATSVAEIEAASGLSPGAGGLYRHFRSKEDVLAAAVREHITRTSKQISAALQREVEIRDRPLVDRLRLVATIGMGKMREEADLIRVLFRDLDKFPNLIAEMREGIVNPLYDMIAKWLAAQIDATPHWKRVAPVPLQTVCVRHEPPALTGDALDTHTLAWVRRINESGKAYLTPAMLDGRWMVRVSIGAEATEREHVEQLWALMKDEASRG